MAQAQSAKQEKDEKWHERIVKKYGLESAMVGPDMLRHSVLDDLERFFEKNQGIRLDEIKDTESPYHRFMKLLREKKFPQGGENANKFLEALTKGPKEKKYATDLLRRMDEGTEVLTQKKEEKHVEEMHELRKEESSQEEVTKVGTVVKTMTTSAETVGRYADVLKKHKEEVGHYKAEKLPKGVEEDYKNISELLVLQEEAASLTRRLYDISKDPNAEKNKIVLAMKKSIETRLEAVDGSIDKVVATITGMKESPEENIEVANKLLDKIKDFDEKVAPQLEKEKNRQEALKLISKWIGVPDINKTKVIEVLKPIKDGGLSSQRERIEITGIEFDDTYGKEEEELGLPKSEVGKPIISYKYLDRDGREETKSGKIGYLNFLKNLV